MEKMTPDRLRNMSRTFKGKIGEMDEATIGRIVKECAEDPAKYTGNENALIAGVNFYYIQPIHQCYWNDRFAIAILCNLPFDMKRVGCLGRD